MSKLEVRLTPKEYLFSYLQFIFNKKIFKFTIFLYFATVLTIFTIDEINRTHSLLFIELLITALATLYYFLLLLIYILLIFFLAIVIHILVNRNTFKKEVEYGMEESGAHFVIFVDQKYTGKIDNRKDGQIVGYSNFPSSW